MSPGRLGVLVAVAVVVVVAAGALVAAHGNGVSVSPQVVTEEGVLVESASITQEGYVAVHRDDGGEPGEVMGHASLEQGDNQNVRVPLDAMPDGQQRVWVVLHEDDGDGEFNAGDDPPLESFGSVAGRQIMVSPGDRPVYLSAPSEASQSVADGTVTVDRVAAAEDGRVLVQTVEGREPGDVVGSASVSAGVNEDVTVELDDGFVEEQGDYFGVYVTLANADGEAIEIGGESVSTRLSLQKAPADDGVGVVTDTATDGDQNGDDGGSGGSLLAQPGFGVLLTVGVIAVLLVVGLRARRDS